MKSITGMWFLCKIRHEKTMDDGTCKTITEQFVVAALSFTEAEARITKEISSYVSGDFEVVEIDRCKFKEIFFVEEGVEADKYYKAKLQFITIDEKTEKEKKTSVYYLVQADSFEHARKNIDEVMGDTSFDYVISSVSETQVLDVYKYKND